MLSGEIGMLLNVTPVLEWQIVFLWLFLLSSQFQPHGKINDPFVTQVEILSALFRTWFRVFNKQTEKKTLNVFFPDVLKHAADYL